MFIERIVSWIDQLLSDGKISKEDKDFWTGKKNKLKAMKIDAGQRLAAAIQRLDLGQYFEQ